MYRDDANIRRGAACGLACAAAMAVAACSSGGGGNLFSTGSPFSSASVVDRTFIGAAQTWDLDKNAIVTCDEWKQYATSALREADVNSDGSLTSDEFSVMAKSDRLFDIADLKYYDANSNGRVSIEELTGKKNRAFTLLDKNNDCQIARDESAQVVARDKPKKTGLSPEEQLERMSR